MKTLKDILRTVAPTIATALGGPYAGVAVKALADKFLPGAPIPSEAELLKAVSADPEALLKATQVENDFKTKMAEYGIELEKLETEDRASARAMQMTTRDWVPGALALTFTLAFFLMVAFLMRYRIPPENKDAVYLMLGALAGSVTTILTFYFGSSKSSQTKDAILGRAIAKGKDS